MANESSAETTIEILPLNENLKDHKTLLLKYYVILQGILSDFYYGISDENWTWILQKTNNNNNLINTSSIGRWSFNSSLDNKCFEKKLNKGLSNKFENTSSFPVDNHLKENINIMLNNLNVSPINWTSDNLKNILILKNLTQRIGSIINDLNFKSLVDPNSDEIQILKITYNDYEPGQNFIEIDGEYRLNFDPQDNTFQEFVLEGSITDQPSIDILYECGFSEHDSEDMLNQFYEIYPFKSKLKELPEYIYKKINQHLQDSLSNMDEYNLFDMQDEDNVALDNFKEIFKDIATRNNLNYSYDSLIKGTKQCL